MVLQSRVHEAEPKKIIFTEKHLDLLALSSRHRLLVLEGTVRSSKTVIAIQAFFYRVYNSKNLLHMIAGRDFDTINDNILESNGMGLLVLFPEYCSLARDKIGGYYVKMETPKGDKKILLVGYDNKSKWKKILGSSIECIFVDEVNIADPQFIRECFARQTSFDSPFTIWTLNGDIPTHYIYQEYINHCKIIGKAPASTVAEMNKFEKKPGWYYMHFTMKDNPIMTPKKIEDAQSIYPVGSYYYKIKILGERGVPGVLIYNDYMNESLIIDPDAKDEFGRPKYVFSRYVIGVDIGTTRAYNSFALVGFTADYSKCCILDLMTFQQIGYDTKKQKLLAFALKHRESGKFIEKIAIDSAELNFIHDIKAEFSKHGLVVVGSYKVTIKERIDMNIVGFSTGRVLFSKDCMEAYNAFLIAKWVEGKEGIEREDKNEKHNDIIDSVEYAQTTHMKALMRASAREAS